MEKIIEIINHAMNKQDELFNAADEDTAGALAQLCLSDIVDSDEVKNGFIVLTGKGKAWVADMLTTSYPVQVWMDSKGVIIDIAEDVEEECELDQPDIQAVV